MKRASLQFHPALENLPVYQPGRPIDEVARELGLNSASIIKLASNENPLGPSPRAVAAMRDALASLHLYPDGNAFHLKRKLAASLGVEPANLVLGNGSNEVLELVGHALMAPGTEVVVSEFCFAVYPIVTKLCGAELVTVPAREFGHDLGTMLAAVTPRTRVMFVANPNNPTGTLASAADVSRLIEAMPPHVLLVMDEAYIEFLDAPQDLLPLMRSGDRPNLLFTRTFSKIHGLAGARIGYGIGHPDTIAALEKIRQPFNINSVAQAGALAALDDRAHVEQTRRNNAEGLRFFEREFAGAGIEFIPSSANFILARVGDGARVFEAMQHEGVITRPMGIYKLPAWLRITVGTPAENARCLAALRRALGRG
jgi:histidinol-phosphate aminotransferase